ncbi:MAG TPA: hypothetical protein VM942_09715 [Acidimicrobiales bacterium]|nr:hypothetical protein [Acidimicrobiales bacterium]
MSSPSWDFPSPSANPSFDDEDLEREQLERGQIEALERELLEQLERGQIEVPEAAEIAVPEQIEARNGERREAPPGREQIEERERDQLEQLARMARMGQIDAADIEPSEQSEREQLEQLERESLRQLERLERLEGQQSTHVTAAPPPAERPRPAPSAAVADDRPGMDAEARAAAFLAAANQRQALLDEAAGGVRPSAPATERRELNEPARAARAIVEHRHRNLVEANALLADARRVLAPIAYRGISDRVYRRRKVILAIGEAASLAVAFSAAFDVAPIEALLLSGAIALAFVIAGDLGGILRITAERSRLSAAMEDDAVRIDPRYLHILYHDRQQWLSIIGGATAGVFALAAVSVGVLRAANQGSLGLAAGLGLLTVSLAIAAGLSSWQHASIGSEIIDHLQREEQAAARRLKRAAAARVLRRPQVLTVVGGEELETPSWARDVDWQVPDVDWQTPIGVRPARRPAERVGRTRRAAREKPDKRGERSSGSGVVGSAAARGAVFLATLPGKLRRPEKAPKGARSAKAASAEELGDGPGALGESPGPISDVTFTPPVVIQRKFP